VELYLLSLIRLHGVVFDLAQGYFTFTYIYPRPRVPWVVMLTNLTMLLFAKII
jgi:hypothetical protein